MAEYNLVKSSNGVKQKTTSERTPVAVPSYVTSWAPSRAFYSCGIGVNQDATSRGILKVKKIPKMALMYKTHVNVKIIDNVHLSTSLYLSIILP